MEDAPGVSGYGWVSRMVIARRRRLSPVYEIPELSRLWSSTVRSIASGSRLCRSGPGPDIETRRHRDPRQSFQPQTASSKSVDRSGGRNDGVPAALQSRLQPHRKGLLQAQGTHLWKAAERTVSGLWDKIGKLFDLVEPKECRNYFNSCGYDPT